MEQEHRAVLDKGVTIAAEREVDLLIVARGIYDGQTPYDASWRLFYNALVGLHRARPGMITVIVAGNHDAPSRLEAPDRLLQAFDVHAVGSTLDALMPIPMRTRIMSANLWVMRVGSFRSGISGPAARRCRGAIPPETAA